MIYRSTIECPCKNNQHKHHLIVDMKKEPTANKNWNALRNFFPKKAKSYSSERIRDQAQLDIFKNKFKMIEC